MLDESHLVDLDDPEPYQPDDSDPFDPDNEQMLGCLVRRLRRVAISCCNNNVQVAEGVAQEALLRLHRKKPWLQPTRSSYGGVLAWVTVVTKNIRNTGYTKQKRRDALQAEVQEKFGEPLNKVAETEDRMFLEEGYGCVEESAAVR